MDSDSLSCLGWSDRWRALFNEYAEHVRTGGAAYARAGRDLVPARVIRADRGSVLVATGEDVLRARSSSHLRKEADSASALPAVGDWVVLRLPPGHDVALVEAILPRASAFTRGDPGRAAISQVLAANIDTVFVVHPIAEEPNLRRIERELAISWESGAIPVVVLTKADLSPDPDRSRAAVESVALGADVLLTSALDGTGIAAIAECAVAGRTVALIGPSGAGKSTLINALLGEERQKTREVRLSDGKGRHATVARELVPLPNGAALIDTPGLRAIAVFELDAGLDAAFADIAQLAEACRFADCTHSGEPGCAVEAAVDRGELPVERLESWRKLRREAEVAAMRTDARLRAEEVRKWKIRYKSLRQHHKYTGRHGL